jgi:putative colanic acid biosynthesis UDP-glucose lipid carrier transferase
MLSRYSDTPDLGRPHRDSVLDAWIYREPLTQLALLISDVGAMAVGVLAVMAAGVAPPAPAAAAEHVVAGMCIGVSLLLANGAYRVGELGAARTHLLRMLPAIGGLVAYALAMAQLMPGGSWLASWAAAASILLLAFRLNVRLWWTSAERTRGFARHVAVAGDPSLAGRIAARLETAADNDLTLPAVQVAARVELPVRDGQEAFETGLKRLARLVERGVADTVLLALPWHDEAAVRRTVERLGELAVDVYLTGGLIEHRLAPSRLGGVPCLPLATRPLAGWAALAKEAGDRLLALAALVLTLPVLLLAWTAIRLDSSGPALFRQKRQGLNGRVFEILKFRTMHVDQCADGTRPLSQATRGDPRITRVGRWLRKTSIDELPQLLNVLRGEMSLVGPRPHAVAHDEHYARLIEGYAARRRMKPGLTGWAQVNGYRGETDTLEKMARRVEYDLAYIDNWSLALDLRILLRTLLVGFVHPEAR